MKKVQSKLIDGVAYDEITKRLILHMSNGQRREYTDVPSYVYEDLLVAKSPGTYYFRLIKQKFTLAD